MVAHRTGVDGGQRTCRYRPSSAPRPARADENLIHFIGIFGAPGLHNIKHCPLARAFLPRFGFGSASFGGAGDWPPAFPV